MKWKAEVINVDSLQVSPELLYLLVVSTATPHPLKDQSLMSMTGQLSGLNTNNTAAPTITLVAHYDAGGAAPSLATGGDGNGSGVSLELSRFISMLYSSTISQLQQNLPFLDTTADQKFYTDRACFVLSTLFLNFENKTLCQFIFKIFKLY